MKVLTNIFQWSYTRQRKFEECKRAYYYHYYAFWNGWLADASEEAKKCYLLRRMKTLPMLAGEIVHDLVHSLILSCREGKLIPLEHLQNAAVLKLRTSWKESRDRLWEYKPKDFTNLFEHYYKRVVPQEKADELKQKVLSSLDNFYHSSIFGIIRESDPGNWKEPEEFQRFSIGEHKVSLKMDFAVDRDGTLHIYDWKTGKKVAANQDQLACYALYAQQKWDFSPEKIVLALYYLAGDTIDETTLSQEELARTKETIVRNCREMQALCDDPVSNTASRENFPMTDNEAKCSYCVFQELCKNKELSP